MLGVLEKVKSYLRDNQDTLPFEIELDYDKMRKEGLPCEMTINGSRCWIQGDSSFFEVSSKVKIVNYPMEPNDVDLWIDVNDKVEIEGRTYYLRKTTRYEEYHDLLDRVSDFCEVAKSKNKKIFWTWCH